MDAFLINQILSDSPGQNASLAKEDSIMKCSAEIKGFTNFFDAFESVDRRLQETLEKTAPQYNIFEILNIRHYETKVHTPYLAHLLNPYASHEQGRLFFNSFMNLIFDDNFAARAKNIQVIEEYQCCRGRIDILIQYEIDDEKRALVIENKIYHHDEPEQLKRYHEFLTVDLKLKEGRYHLVYLTPHKEAPSDYSISMEDYRKLKESKSLSEIGYRRDIVPWLEGVADLVKAKKVEDVILQYIHIIKSL